ncbi:hypothetical protein RND71_043305 [Anisodus tanguticus]|uniref:Anaphase-promoting complex subunit 4-like WD40 domain-containing protein n=1 Tax=Anisodus tanguticus TaxID=243964 RepID=A0AAE1QP63_9SOLA|nr:hypothetical protein RND71_043305 [Anisodus tanguticus]
MVSDVEDNEDTNENENINENEASLTKNFDNELQINDNSALTFKLHKKTIFCCNLSSNDKYVVSGDEDDMAYVWKVEDGSIHFQCEGHTDSVIDAKFNINSNYLATIDMKGTIKIWLVENGQCVTQTQLEDLNWIDWHPVLENVLLLGGAEGNCYVVKVNSKKELDLKILSSASNALHGFFLKDGKKCITGHENGSVKLWDIQDSKKIYRFKTDGEYSITCLAINFENTLISIGYEHSQLVVINATNGKKIYESIKEKEDNTIEAMAFSKMLSLLVVCYLDGDIEVLDLKTFLIRDKINFKQGFTKVIFDRINDYKFYVASLDGSIKCLDIRNLELIFEHTGHKSHVLDFQISQKNNFIVSCSEDFTCKVFEKN